jgi:hypothetical protein
MRVARVSRSRVGRARIASRAAVASRWQRARLATGGVGHVANGGALATWRWQTARGFCQSAGGHRALARCRVLAKGNPP